jgi:hypothetical protein
MCVMEDFDPYGVDGFSHIRETCVSWPPPMEVSVDFFKMGASYSVVLCTCVENQTPHDAAGAVRLRPGGRC